MTVLKTVRKKKRLTQEFVASQVGIKVRHYQNVESGESFLSQDKLNLLEDLFELPQRVLLAKRVEEVPRYYQSFIDSIDSL